MAPHASSAPPMEPIAIVGMASVFPMARDLQQFWDNIVYARDCITDVPSSRWNVDDYFDPNSDAPDKTYCKRGGFIPDIEFEPLEFGLPPNFLEVTDVSQLLSLVVARQALEDAGYGNGRSFNRERTGVILGASGAQKLITPLSARLQYPVWERALKSSGFSDQDTQRVIEKIKLAYVRWEENSFPGLLGNVIAGRIANRFDLGGINCIVDAACASSLAALKMALSELAERRCDMMLTGGVDTDNSPFMFLCFSKTPAFSRQERLQPFDAGADGMMVGEGIGMLVLKRLEDAEQDGDRIYAMIRGIGTSSDGRYKSIYAPRSEGQMLALRRAYENARLPADSVGLIEAHGTGTVAGDLCEVSTLRQLFGSASRRTEHIALGSVKSQIGHTKAAAGAAGLIKAALALHQQVLPPTINVTLPHPQFELKNSPLYLNTSARPWISPPSGDRRRAAVSAFGFGGTNYHVVLEEYVGGDSHPGRLHTVAHEIVLHAPTAPELLARCEELLRSAAEAADQTFIQLVDTARSPGIPRAAARLGFVAASADEARDLLGLAARGLAAQLDAASWQHPRGIHYRREGVDARGRVVALFPGQGSQYLDMGRTLALNFPPIRDAFARMDALCSADDGTPLSQIVYPPPAFSAEDRAAQSERLTRTEHAQAAIGALSMGLFELLRRAGLRPDFTAGHSFGEVTALWAAGAIDDDGYVALVHARGSAMAAPRDEAFDAGAMLAVTADRAALHEALAALPGVTIANVNARDQVVLAGPRTAMQQARPTLQQQGFQIVELPVAAAFHTSLVGHAQRPFKQAVEACTFRPASVPVYANTTGRPYPAEVGAMRSLLEVQLLKPVLFMQQIENLYADGGSIFVELGPRNVLTTLVKRILGDRPHIAVALNASRRHDSDRQLRDAVVQLRVAGVELDVLDPYERPPSHTAAHRRKGPIVRLNGSNYVSESTRAAFEAALVDGYQVAASAGPIAGEDIEAMTTVAYVTTRPEDLSNQEGAPAPVAGSEGRPSDSRPGSGAVPAFIQPLSPEERLRVLATLEQGLAHAQSQQRDLMQQQQQFLAYQVEVARLLLQSHQQTAAALQAGSDAIAGLERLDHDLSALYQHQAETLRVHEHFLDRQAAQSELLLRVIEQQYSLVMGVAPGAAQRPSDAPVSETPAGPMPAAAGTSPGRATEAGDAAVAPHPAAGPPPAPPMPPARLDGLATIRAPAVQPLTAPPSELDPWTAPSAPAMSPSIAPPPEPVAAASAPDAMPHAAMATAEPAAAPPAVDERQAAELAEGLLAVVSEKTGYPQDTLELDMDMEADLGIDSIKRVEILATMQARFPDLPRPKAEDLAELRTLAQVVDYLRASQAGVSTPRPVVSHDGDAALPANSQPGVTRGVAHGPARLTSLPPPDELEYQLPRGWTCLITDDGTATTARVAQALAQRGWQVVVLRFPTALVAARPALPPSIGRVVLHDTSDEHLEQALASIAESYGAIAGFIHLHPSFVAGSDPAQLFDPIEKAIVQQVFLIAKHLTSSLNEAARLGRSCFVTVSRLDGAFGTELRHAIGPVGGGLAGLTKSLRQEWSNVFCRALDLSPAMSTEDAAQAVLAELHDPDEQLVEVAYGAGGRVTLVADHALSDGADA